MENYIGLTNEQFALIMGEKVSPALSQGAKRESDVIMSAEVFLQWLNKKQKERNMPNI